MHFCWEWIFLNYSIGEFSAITKLGVHTLRYYEREGLISPSRNSANRRRYLETDVLWVEFIKRLKDTGMPVREIKRYAKLRAEGDRTLGGRLAMLLQHRESINRKITDLQNHRDKLDEKIEFYRKAVASKTDEA